MALLSLEKIREIQNAAEMYATRERERLVRADAAAAQRSRNADTSTAGSAGNRG